MDNFDPNQNQLSFHRSARQGPHWFTLPEHFDPPLPKNYRNAEDEACHLMDSVTRKFVRGDVDEDGFAHLHSTVLNRTIRNRTRGPIIRVLRGRYLQVSPHLAGQHSRGYKLSEEILAQKPVRRACRDLRLLGRIQSEQARLDQEERERWLPIHRDLARLQHGLTVTADADAILETLEAQATFCQRILLSNIRDGRFTFSVSRWGRCFNALCGIKRELRPALRLNGQPLASLDICCAQPALLALLIEATSPTSRLFERTTYLHAP